MKVVLPKNTFLSGPLKKVLEKNGCEVFDETVFDRQKSQDLGRFTFLYLANERCDRKYIINEREKLRDWVVRLSGWTCERLVLVVGPEELGSGIFSDRDHGDSEWIQRIKADNSSQSVLILRSGIVLSKDSGFFPRILGIFKFGFGGRVASGRRFMSWVHEDDFFAFILRALKQDDLQGVVHLASPLPAENRDWVESLGLFIERPTWIWPKTGVKLFLRSYAPPLLKNQKLVMDRDGDFSFKYRHIDEAFADLCFPDEAN